MSGTVKNFDVKFRRGEKQTVKTGAASYAMSYVYNLNAREGQTITVKVESAEKDLTFSVTSPGDDTIKDAFSVKRWSGIAPETGKYSIVLVMNNERAKKVPFRLRIKVE